MEKLSSGLKSAPSPLLVYEQVDAEIEIVFEQEEPTDPNENKCSKRVRNKLAVLEATRDRNEDLIQEGLKVQQEYQDYNKKVSEGCFSQYNPYHLREFVKNFIKFRKGKKCTQGDVRRDLENSLKKPLPTLMISKFENLNFSGTKMVGIKMLLKFWMKTKNLEENQRTALRANQRSMLENLRRDKNLNVLDDSIIDDQNMVNMEPSEDVVLTTENEQTIARFKFDNGIPRRQFDCAEVSENVDIDSGVKEKLHNLKQKERMRKEEEKKENVQMCKERKNLMEQVIGKNVVKKKRGRPFSSHTGLKGGKRTKLEELTNPDQNKAVTSVKRGKSKKHAKVKESKNKKKSEIVKPIKCNSKENKTSKMEKNHSLRRSRCGTCEACSRKDCGACKNCLNMVKFGGSGSIRHSCKTRICPAKTPSGRKTSENRNKNGSNKLEKENSRGESQAANRIAADLKPDCSASESFEEQKSDNIARVQLMPESSSGSDLLGANVRVEVNCDLMDENPGPTSEPESDGQVEPLSNETPAALDHELLLFASSSSSSGAGLSENQVQVGEILQTIDPFPIMTESPNEDGSNFNLTFHKSPCFLTHMQMLMANEENKADLMKMIKEESQFTNSEQTYPQDLSALSQNRHPSEEMSINESPDVGGDVINESPDAGGDVINETPDAGGDVINESPDAGGDVPMAASIIDVLESNICGHSLSSNTGGEIQESNMDEEIQESNMGSLNLECNTDGDIQDSNEVIVLELSLVFDCM